ncbi:hypothetical protein Pint_22196 [Pistacia integerrima]|uniref:Uncharacterized protein n=1 Tax=Pistacia integerrima TaxID=434235 RepID=A0ACC0YIH6_9ROSI|nr:hypothetical protein Pint_22196 [Pistacia integerrima]
MEANYKETNSISASLKSYPMNGGEGPYSYANNSSFYQGLVEEAKVDSFNLPFYFATKQEMELLIQRNGCFKIERMEQMDRPMRDISRPTVEKFASLMRAGFEGIVKQHFGSDELI